MDASFQKRPTLEGEPPLRQRVPCHSMEVGLKTFFIVSESPQHKEHDDEPQIKLFRRSTRPLNPQSPQPPQLHCPRHPLRHLSLTFPFPAASPASKLAYPSPHCSLRRLVSPPTATAVDSPAAHRVRRDSLLTRRSPLYGSAEVRERMCTDGGGDARLRDERMARRRGLRR